MSERIYVEVSSDFDRTGYMQPRTITWEDGRQFKIEKIKDVKPTSSYERGHTGDRYTVIIKGMTRYLFFEREDTRFSSSFGRWFVEA